MKGLKSHKTREYFEHITKNDFAWTGKIQINKNWGMLYTENSSSILHLADSCKDSALSVSGNPIHYKTCGLCGIKLPQEEINFFKENLQFYAALEKL